MHDADEQKSVAEMQTPFITFTLTIKKRICLGCTGSGFADSGPNVFIRLLTSWMFGDVNLVCHPINMGRRYKKRHSEYRQQMVFLETYGALRIIKEPRSCHRSKCQDVKRKLAWPKTDSLGGPSLLRWRRPVRPRRCREQDSSAYRNRRALAAAPCVLSRSTKLRRHRRLPLLESQSD